MKNDIFKLECIDITVDFYGVCKNNGLVVFVKGLIPGEIADIKIVKEKNNIAYGIINKLIIPSKYRINAPCSISNKCGGCDIQYIDYNYQLELKKKLIENTIKNNKMDIKVLDPIPSKNILGYRNKIQVPVRNNKIGYYRNHSNDIVEFETCCIADYKFNEILNDIKLFIFNNSLSSVVRHIVIRSASEGLMVCLVVNDFTIPSINVLVKQLTDKYNNIKSIILNKNEKETNVIFGDLDKCIYGEEYIIDKCNDISYMIPLRSFYQINNLQMINLYDYIANNTGLTKNNKVLDLFCGIGTISLYISKYVSKVLGIEIIDKSIEYANVNKKLNDIKNVEFINGNANDIDKYIKEYDVVILDPPRKGIEPSLVSAIINSNVDKIIYISCNQSTLIRDIKLFKDVFECNEIQPIDMFPQTKHIECITVLNRIK